MSATAFCWSGLFRIRGDGRNGFTPMEKSTPPQNKSGLVSKALHALVSQIPTSTERAGGSNAPERARAIAKRAALKAAAVSGTFSLPIGPLGLATVIPDLLTLWRIQRQMVADIATIMGKKDMLVAETMVICLFKHGGVALTDRLFAPAGDDIVVQRIANRTLQQLLEKIAVRMMQRIAAKSIARWVPIVGALGAGAYAYYDTTQVAANTLELFGRPVRLRPESTAISTRRKPAPLERKQAQPERAAAPKKRATRTSRTPRRT